MNGEDGDGESELKKLNSFCRESGLKPRLGTIFSHCALFLGCFGAGGRM